jgi:hypothetical protein
MTKEGFRDPYSSQNRRAAGIAERYAATHTPDTLPEHLEPAMEAAEAHFAKTAPGKKVATTTEVEAPHQDTVPEPPEIYFDPTTGEEHEIDQSRPFTKKDGAALISKAGRKTLTVAQMNANERAHIAKARADRRASGF